MSQKQPRVFEYIVLYHPNEERLAQGDISKILQPLKQILAMDMKDAEEKAMDDIPAGLKGMAFELFVHEWGK